MRYLYYLIFLLVPLQSYSQTDSVEKRIIVIGDAGALVGGKAPVLDAIRRNVPLTKNTVVIFTGDNLYGHGLPNEQYSYYNDLKNVLDTQVNLVKGTAAKAYFLPGNHDWANGNPEGLESIIRQQRYIDQISRENVKFYPEDGCPGPVDISIGENVKLIIFDSQWWLHQNSKPGIESDCACKTRDELLTAIKDIIDNNPRKLILFACHHPFKSTGPHSGYFGIKQHIFPFTDVNKQLYIPLPILGSIYPISRSVFGSPQDLRYPDYQNMVNEIDEVLKTHPYVIHVHGHEHSLQLITDSNYHYLISGAGCKRTRVNKNKKVAYSAQSLGYAVLDIMKNRDVNVSFYEVPLEGDTITKAYSQTLLNFSKFPELAKDTVTVHEFVFKDSVVAAINAKYDTASAFKRFILGDNYRKEWATPVKLKVFNINKERGGFKIEGLGGGHQSKSLHLVDKKGKRWTLRSLNKDPEMVLPSNFRNSIASRVMYDMMSASHPYGPLVIPTLSEALEIPHPKPQFFFVPDDYALGYYRPVFANTACMLEELEPTIEGENARSTGKMWNKLLEDNDKVVNQHMLLKARLLDFLIADFDRHENQWKWGDIDTGKGKSYYPIPRDRDQAFFNSDGLLLGFASRKLTPYLQGFKYKIKNPSYLGYVARDLDRTFLNELDEREWRTALHEFETALTDSVIKEATGQLPPEIASLDSGELASKLIYRRDKLPKKAMTYYRYISKRINVIGSNNDEYFHLSNNDSGVLVTVRAKDKKGKYSFERYTRQIDPKVTKELRLFGLNGDDVFRIDDDVKTKIKVTAVGGQGADTFDMRGRVRNYIYDLKTMPNPIIASNRSKNLMSSKPDVNDASIKGYNYDILRFPQIKLGYNPEDKLMVGVGMWVRKYGFRRAPYSSDQKLSVLFAPENHAYQARYGGDFINMIGENDIVLNASYVNPVLNNFFGLGNETVKLDTADLYFYRTRYKYVSGDALLRRRFFNNVFSVAAGPTIYHYWNRYINNTDRILANPEVVGLDSTSIYSPKLYAGAKMQIKVNNLNDDLFPTRGIDWTTELVGMRGIGENSKPFTKLESNMGVYASLSDPAKVVAVLHLGGGKILSNQYEYFQALTLGANNFLRGYRKNRFSGSSYAYASIELRVKVVQLKNYLLPGSLGLIGFNDVGRVWIKTENSGKWHDGYGGGIYFTPFNRLLVSATMAFSEEDRLFNFGIGTKINLTF
jgi:hypothetical protein